MSAQAPRRVFVFGGTGMMGQRIVAMLQDQLPPHRVVSVSRNGDVRADVAQPETVALSPGDVVIDAVGPYLHEPRAIVQHCLRNGAHYIDLTELQEFHDRTALAVSEHEQNHAVSSAVVQGCSTTPAMVDALVPDHRDFTRKVLLSVGSRNKISAALAYGLVQPLGHKHPGGRYWHDTTTRILLSGQKRRYGSHPSPNKDDRTSFYCGLDYRAGYWLLRGMSVFTRRMSKTRLLAMCEAALPAIRFGRFFGTLKGSLRIERYDGDHLKELVEIRAANEGLKIPALPAVWAALALLERDDVAGITPLSELIDSKAIITDLEARGYVVDQIG